MEQQAARNDSGLIARVREMYDAGWTCGEIARLSPSQFGRKLHQSTVYRWTHPEYAERERHKKREYMALREAGPHLRGWMEHARAVALR